MLSKARQLESTLVVETKLAKPISDAVRKEDLNKKTRQESYLARRRNYGLFLNPGLGTQVFHFCLSNTLF